MAIGYVQCVKMCVSMKTAPHKINNICWPYAESALYLRIMCILTHIEFIGDTEKNGHLCNVESAHKTYFLSFA